ncbi:hypothetical protein D3C72_2456810 [compost metagenome]
MVGRLAEVMAVGHADECNAMLAGAGGGLFDRHGARGKRQARAGVDQRRAAAFVHEARHGRTDGAAGA